MAQSDRRRLHALVMLYVALALGWVAFARWIVPPLLIEERPGRILAFVKRSIQNVPAPFLTRDILGCWREFSEAVLIALVLHLSIVLILRREDLRGAEGRASADARPGRHGRFVLLIVPLAFLAVTVLSGARHDYFLYLQMWYEVRLGHDPWFTVFGINGEMPLNAYGPLFNLLAALSWVNPLAPKLLFAYGYILFVISQIKGFTASRRPTGLRSIVLPALFWNPFPWVEIAIRGHFDILVGLLCLGAIRAWSRGHDIRAGLCLALGVLLKYFPVVLLPALALDRGRLRPRFLKAAMASITLGLGLSCYLWGLSTLSPLMLAATRRSTVLSIFRYIRGPYSPLVWFGLAMNYDYLAPIFLFVALLCAWWWSWTRHPGVEASAVVAVTATVLFYHTGYPQYQMVPFVLGSSWVVRHRERIRGRAVLVVAVACYFGWLAAFDVYYSFVDEGGSALYWYFAQDVVGLPSFLFGCAFLGSVVWSETLEDEGGVHRLEAGGEDAEGPRGVARPHER
jgi:glycosyl transferase family 87